MAALSIIIVSWNTRELLRRCLDSVVNTQGTHTAEVIVVDNGSGDGSQEMLQSEYPWITLVQNAVNVGFARANNQGSARATAPLLLLLNSDAALRPGALETVVAAMNEHAEIGIAGLCLLNDDGTLQPSGKRLPTLWSTLIALSPLPESWRIAYDRRHNARDFDQLAFVGEVSAAAMAIRRDLYVALGGFDESFYFFGEDVDLCWRAAKHGYKVVYLPTAQAVHSWGGARARTPSVRQGLLSQRAQYHLIERHRPAWEARILRAYLILFTLVRAARTATHLASHSEAAAHTTVNLYLGELSWLMAKSWKNRHEQHSK